MKAATLIFMMLGLLGTAGWMSPRVLSYIAAKCLARKQAILTQRIAYRWWISRFDEEA